jgi:hypothetical protein
MDEIYRQHVQEAEAFWASLSPSETLEMHLLIDQLLALLEEALAEWFAQHSQPDVAEDLAWLDPGR